MPQDNSWSSPASSFSPASKIHQKAALQDTRWIPSPTPSLTYQLYGYRVTVSNYLSLYFKGISSLTCWQVLCYGHHSSFGTCFTHIFAHQLYISRKRASEQTGCKPLCWEYPLSRIWGVLGLKSTTKAKHLANHRENHQPLSHIKWLGTSVLGDGTPVRSESLYVRTPQSKAPVPTL